MARNFMKVYRNIVAVAPEELVQILGKELLFWAPEIEWQKLSEYVNRYIVPSSSDPQSIAIYAELLGISLAEMKERFEADGR